MREAATGRLSLFVGRLAARRVSTLPIAIRRSAAALRVISASSAHS